MINTKMIRFEGLPDLPSTFLIAPIGTDQMYKDVNHLAALRPRD